MDKEADDPPMDQTRDIDRGVNRDMEAAMALLAPYESLLLAVSGGPDSVALMLSCARWRARHSHAIIVATVDHGLRAGSRSEAEAVADWTQALGFDHHLLSWEGEKPSTRLQERARAARYALLAACAQRVGANAIVTAHHADDQAETILFRLTRGSGVAGLAGMPAVSSCNGVSLLRPLLGFGKRELINVCTRESHPFFEDPSNASEQFTRARLRKLAPLLAAEGLDRDALLRLSARAARADAALAQHARETFERARIDGNAPLSLDASILRSAPQEILQRMLALALHELSPHAALRLERLERAAARIAQALETRDALRLTLADVLIETSAGDVKLVVAPPRKVAVKQRNA